ERGNKLCAGFRRANGHDRRLAGSLWLAADVYQLDASRRTQAQRSGQSLDGRQLDPDLGLWAAKAMASLPHGQITGRRGSSRIVVGVVVVALLAGEFLDLT